MVFPSTEGSQIEVPGDYFLNFQIFLRKMVHSCRTRMLNVCPIYLHLGSFDGKCR